MTKKLTHAIRENTRAAKDLDDALRDCIAAIRDEPDNVVEGRFRVVSSRRRSSSRT